MRKPLSNDHQKVDAFAVFAGAIDNNTVARFATAIANGMTGGVTDAHILFQSGGGIVGDGVCLYNFFRGAPMNLTLYNSGTICSAAAIAFLGAERRMFSAHATFMVHRSQTPSQSASSVELKHLAHSADLDDARMEAIIRESSSLTQEQLTIFQAHNLWLSADEALQAGIATGLGEFAPPMGHIISII